MGNDALIETWGINNRVNLLVVDELSDEALRCSLSKRGGRTVGQQMVHAIDNRRRHLERMDREIAAALVPITREDGHDKDLLRRALESSADGVAEIIARSPPEGRIKGWKRGIVAFVGYLIAHEAHHRGGMLLTVKECGIKRPETLRYGLWDWNRL